MKTRNARTLQYALRIAAVALLTACWLQTATAQTSDTAAAAEAAAQQSWRDFMAHNPSSELGCFEASYPNISWERVQCTSGRGRMHTALRKPKNGQTLVVGNGADYVAEASGLISETVGSFPTVTGVKTEKSVGVAAFGDGGILGANEYSLQINTNFNETTSACAGHSGCTVWQQFVYATDYYSYPKKGKAALFIEYWLINWGNSACPTDWDSDGEGDCVINSDLIEVPDAKPKTTLAELSLAGTATNGGNDTAVFTNGTKAYTFTGSDSVLDISEAWKESEFNIIGDAGGSEAVFNKGVSITVKVALTDGSTSAPTCVPNAGTTGETNNLNLGACSTSGGTSPYIEFPESN